MAIQQVASSSPSQIMSFLFQDDGSADGAELDGAGFAKTLHQLLGEDDAEEPAGEKEAADKTTLVAEPRTSATPGTDSGRNASVPQHLDSAASSPPSTPELEGRLQDFVLPQHSAELPVEAGVESKTDGHESDQPFWGFAPFTDVVAAQREQTNAAHGTGIDAAANDTAALEQSAAPAASAAPVFNNGIAHVIELARDAAQVSTELTQQGTAPQLPLQAPTGRNAPLGGKLLPQAFRAAPSALNLNQAGAGASAKATPAPLAGDMTAALPSGEATVSNSFFADLLNVAAEAPSQPGTSAPSQAAPQGIHALHPQSPLANLPKAANDAAPANPMQHMQSPHLAGSDAWFQDLGARVDWLKDMKVDKAELQLHPAELGLLEIHVSTGDDATTVSFVTHNSDARQMIEDNMPRLRDLLASQGMQLGQSHVSQHSEGQRRHDGQPGGAPSHAANTQADEAAPARRRAYVADPNRIDHYV